MNRKCVRKDDQAAVLTEVGPVVLAIFREAVDEGFHAYNVSRSRDAGAFPQYSACTRANMLSDRMTAAARDLCATLPHDVPDLSWRQTLNKRATEFFLDNRFALRIKRTKRNRGNLSTNVPTSRQRTIRSEALLPVGQMVLPFRSNGVELVDERRIWLTVGFDLDDLEEAIERVVVGVELLDRFLWKVQLPEPDVRVIARLSPTLANRISAFRTA